MQIEEYEDLIRTEAEELWETLLGVAYFDLPLELQTWIWARSCESFWQEYVQRNSVQAA